MKRLLSTIALLIAIFVAAPAFATKTCTRLTEGFHDSGSGTTANTASISPSAGAVVVGVFAFDTTNMSISGGGLTWTTKVDDAPGPDGGLMWVFIGASSSPSSGPLTLTFDEGAFVTWAVDGITGTVNISAPSNANVANATGTGTAPAATLGAFGNAANGVWAYGYMTDAPASITPGSGYTLVDSNIGGAMFGHSDFSQCIDTNDTSVDATISVSVTWGLVAIEVVDSAGAGGSNALPKILQQLEH